MPFFEGLFPGRDDQLLQDLLFTRCTWHTYTELGPHTTSTPTGLKASTRSLGHLLRDFVKKICPKYETKGLPQATQARPRANAPDKEYSKRADPKGKNPKTGRVQKLFNLLTYKLYALGDYVTAILQFGPSNSYSTQTVRLCRLYRVLLLTFSHAGLEHKINKGRTFQRQISKHQRCKRTLRRIASQAKQTQKQAELGIPAQQS